MYIKHAYKWIHFVAYMPLSQYHNEFLCVLFECKLNYRNTFFINILTKYFYYSFVKSHLERTHIWACSFVFLQRKIQTDSLTNTSIYYIYRLKSPYNFEFIWINKTQHPSIQKNHLKHDIHQKMIFQTANNFLILQGHY